MIQPVRKLEGSGRSVRAGSSILAFAKTQLSSWLRVWRIPRPGAIEVVANPRLRRSRARWIPALRRIELRPDVAAGPRQLMLEALCHEAAHAAVFLIAPAARPHGAEWRAFVEAAGFTPRVAHIERCRFVAKAPANAPAKAPVKATSAVVFEHVCPVCQMVRTSTRRVARWRCAACVSAGLPGELEISRRLKGRGAR